MNLFIRLLYFLPFCFSAAFASDIQLRAFFQPSQIHLGQSAQYVVETSGDIAQFAYQPPQIDGLRFLSSQSMQSLQAINGRPSIQLTRTFRVQARRTGTFTIPSQSLSIHGKNYELPAATLRVLDPEESLEDEEEMYSRSSYSHSQEPSVQLSATLPTSLYIGEVVPIKIELKFPRAYPCNLLQPNPTPLENTWLHGPFSKPYEVPSRNNGRDAVYCWDTTISAIKSGESSLQYSLDVVIQTMDAFSSLFSLFSNNQGEQLQVLSKKLSVQIADLPTPRPDFFGEGIGHFSISKAHISDQQTLLEEPLTLRLELEGQGNWERMSPPELLYDADEWRVYPPKCDFHSSDALQYSGKKTFDYVIIPLKTGKLSAPTAVMSYFDPQKKTYQTLRHEFQEPILVSRTQQIASQATSTKSNISRGTTPKPDGEKNDALETSEGNFFYLNDTAHFKCLTPLYRQRCFWRWQLWPLMLYLTWLSWRYIKKQKSKTSFRDDPKRHRRQMFRYLKQAQKAIDRQQIEAASQALQEALYAFLIYRKICDSRSMTYGEIRQICETKFQNPEHKAIIHSICHDLELQHFSPSSISQNTLQKDLDQLKKLFHK
jgi:hypothetical protein